MGGGHKTSGDLKPDCLDLEIIIWLDKGTRTLKIGLSIVDGEDLPPSHTYFKERLLKFRLLFFMQRHLPSAQYEAHDLRDAAFEVTFSLCTLSSGCEVVQLRQEHILHFSITHFG